MVILLSLLFFQSALSGGGYYGGSSAKNIAPLIAAFQSSTGTSGQFTITVSSNTGIANGQFVTGTGIGAGATVTNVSGTTITLSVANTANLSSVNVTFYSGNYVIAWIASVSITSGQQANYPYYEIISSSGAQVVAPTQINGSYTNSNNSQIAVCALTGGGFAYVYINYAGGTANKPIYGIISSTGSVVVSSVNDTLYSQTTTVSQMPAIAALPNGSFVMVQLFHHDIADGLGDDLEHLENRHPAADQRGQGAGEPRQADFVGDGAKDRQADPIAIPELAAESGLDEIEPAIDHAAAAQQDEDQELSDKVAEVDQVLRRGRERGAKVGEDFAEHRHNFHQQENGDENRHHGYHRRVHHGGFDFFAEAGGVFQINGQARQDFGQQTALFAGRHHAGVEPAECPGMLLQSIRETVAAFDAGADVADGVAHHLVGGLVGQRLQGLHHCQAGVDHRGQLPRKDDQVGESHAAAGGAAFFADFLLDRNDQQVAVQQRGNGCLFRGGLDRTANLPATDGFASYIDERSHKTGLGYGSLIPQKRRAIWFMDSRPNIRCSIRKQSSFQKSLNCNRIIARGNQGWVIHKCLCINELWYSLSATALWGASTATP